MKTKKLRPFSNKAFREEDIMFLSFDTETNSLGGDLLLITACSPKGTHVFSGDMMIANFFELMIEHPYPYVWYAHNAQYDWRYFIQYIVDSQIYCQIHMRTETDIYQIDLFIDGVRVVMRDSLAIFPGKLSDFAKSFTPEIPKGNIDFELTSFDLNNPEHIEYAKRDAEILRVGMPRLNSMLVKHFGINLGCTTAGTSLKAWQYSLREDERYSVSEMGEQEDFIRSSYFGGLVFLTTTHTFESQGVVAETYDLNSSYPYAMCTYGVPSGRMIQTDDYENGLMGIYRVKVRTPSLLNIPILPRRNEKGYMRWSRGEFETCVTSSELIYAVKNGYEILDIFEGYAWEEVAYPFNTMIDRCRKIRIEYQGKPEETLAKLIQNSLYGKFGSKRNRIKVFMPENDDDLIDAQPVDEQGYFWCREEVSDSLRCKPEWAVFITAHARLKLISTAYSVGVENVIYGDTDSLTVLVGNSHCFDQGSEYGQWKLEKRWKSFRAIAPKVYVGQLEDGRYKGAVKGIPKKTMTPESWNDLLKQGQIESRFDTLPSLRVAMKKGVFPAKQTKRVSTDIRNSVNWELIGDRVYPKIA